MTSELDWSLLREKIQRERWQPMYDSEIHGYLKSLFKEPYPNWNDLAEKYIDTFHQWIQSSQLNKLEGLSAFPHRDVCVGVTHSLDDLHICYGDRLVVLEKEYKYHLRIRPQIKIKKTEALSEGDVLVISLPFCNSGNIHHEMDSVLEICLKNRIPIHIDSAWFGACRDIYFDYSHPAVQSVSFSLSKGLGLGSHRTGLRYSRERLPGPVTVTNNFKFYIQSSVWIGLKFMQKFNPDYLQNKYADIYKEVCKNLELKPSSTIFVAYEKNPNGNYYPVGLRPILRWISEQKY